jgi:outer membrane biosynthesis protein TonB
MKTSTLIFLCSLICFAACSNPILSEALRSSASIDLESEDHALIQTESKNKVKSLAYARQNKDAKVENKPAAAAPAKASQPKPSGQAKKPIGVAAAANVSGSSPKPVAKAMNVAHAEKKPEKPKATAAQKAEFEKKEKTEKKNKKEKKIEKSSGPKPAGPSPKNDKSAEANKSTTATTVNVKSAQGTASKRTTGSSFISLSMTVMGMLFALF